jgi:hypothetical protein
VAGKDLAAGLRAPSNASIISATSGGPSPKVVSHASGHRGRHLKRLMDTNETVEHGVERNCASVVLDLL